MDEKDIDSSSDESLGSDGDEPALKDASGNKIPDDDSLLDSSDESDAGEQVDDMDIDEEAVIEQLNDINNKLVENPYAYELYVEKIKILKTVSDLEKLRETREKFSEMYPLAESIWLEWLRDEIQLACTDEEHDAVEKLFERAIADYLSVDIWLEYINYCIGRMGSENGQQKCREVFERALGSCGIHASMGSLVWDMYRDFEAALLGTTTTEEELQAQENRFISLCRRQLSVPLLGLRKTYEDMKAKIEIDENTEKAYKSAVDRLSSLETWEAKLVEQQDKIKVYREYIEDEKKLKSKPARVQCLYERAISDFPLDSSLWIEYLDYLFKNLKIDTIILDAANRASRNCSWDINIWIKYMNAVEIFCDKSKTFESMKSIFEKAIIYCSTGEGAGTVWLKYLEFLRRRMNLDDSSTKDADILRKTFTAAEQHLLQLVAEPSDYILEVLLFRLRFETQQGKEASEDVDGLWKDILHRGYGQYAKTWLQYIIQEVSSGADARKLRSLYSKAISYIKDDFQTVSSLWINFERDRGDLSSLKQCESKISSIIARNALELSQAAEQQASITESTLWNRNSDVPSKGMKRKMTENGSSDSVPMKKGKQVEDTVDGDKTSSVFKMPSVPVINNKNTQEKTVRDSTTHHGELIKHDSSKDNRTVFVSNLAFTTNETDITDFFKETGKIEEVRLVKDYKGRSKGFGYVFFTKIEEAKAALGKDRQPLGGRPTFVSKCDPDKSTRQKQFKYPTNLEKNKLFIKGLPFSLTADELRDLFKVHGDLKDCRLVTYRNGHSKGLAYVEYIDEACAKQAILKADGSTVGDKTISVELSNPPTRDSFKSNSGSYSKTLDTIQRRTPKAFVPRSVQVTQNVKEESTLAEKSTVPKSNADFRSMFLKK